MIDIGANLTHASFKEDLGEVVSRAREAGVTSMVVTGTTVEESREAAAIAERWLLSDSEFFDQLAVTRQVLFLKVIQ